MLWGRDTGTFGHEASMPDLPVPPDPTDMIVAYALKKAEKTIRLAVKKKLHDATDEQKFCRVCGERIKANAKFLTGKRFYCSVCGHRTHKHCAGNLDAKVCQRCVDERR